MNKKGAVTIQKKIMFLKWEIVLIIFIFYILEKLKFLMEELITKKNAMSFIKSGDLFGYRGLLSSDTYPVSSQTITDSHICYVPSNVLLTLIYNTPKLSKYFISLLINTLNQDDLKLKSLSVLSVREKVADGLLYLIENFGLNNSS